MLPIKKIHSSAASGLTFALFLAPIGVPKYLLFFCPWVCYLAFSSSSFSLYSFSMIATGLNTMTTFNSHTEQTTLESRTLNSNKKSSLFNLLSITPWCCLIRPALVSSTYCKEVQNVKVHRSPFGSKSLIAQPQGRRQGSYRTYETATLNMIFSVTYYSELHIPISFSY